MNHIKTFILLLVALTSTASISCQTETEGKAQRDKDHVARQNKIKELTGVIKNYNLPSKEQAKLNINITYKDCRAAAAQLLTLVESGDYTPDLEMYHEILAKNSIYSDMFQEKYRPLEILAKYNKRYSGDKGLSKEDARRLASIISGFIDNYNHHHKDQAHSQEKITEYSKRVMALLEEIVLKNIDLFMEGDFLPKILKLACITRGTGRKVARHMVDLIKNDKYKPDFGSLSSLVSFGLLDSDQMSYLSEYIKNRHPKTKEDFTLFVTKDYDGCNNPYITYDTLLAFFEEVNNSYQTNKGKYETDFIMYVMDLMVSRLDGQAVITVNYHRLIHHCQELLLKNLDRICPEDLANVLTAKYLDDEAGRKIAKKFMDKITGCDSYLSYKGLLHALHSRYIKDKQRSVILDMMMAKYESCTEHKPTYKDDTRDNGNIDSFGILFGSPEKWHGFYAGEFYGCNSNTGGIMHNRTLSCRYLTEKQLTKVLDFIEKNYAYRDVILGYKRMQEASRHCIDERLVNFFDLSLRGYSRDDFFVENCAWYIAMHKASRDDQRLAALKIIMQRGDTINCIKSSLRKLKKPLRGTCGPGDKCTEGKEPCCLASVKKYLTEFKYKDKWGRRKNDSQPEYTKFNCPPRKPNDKMGHETDLPKITDDDLPLYLENIEGVDVNSLCCMLSHPSLDKKARKKVLETIKVLTRYLTIRDLDLLLPSRHVPDSYKKKLVKKMMEERKASRAMVAYKHTSLKEAIFMYKHCGHNPYTGYFDNNPAKTSCFEAKEMYGPYADKYMDVLQHWIDQGDPDQRGENQYLQHGFSFWGYGMDSCSCGYVLNELLGIMWRGGLSEGQRRRAFKYILYYFDLLLDSIHDVKHCEYSYGLSQETLRASDLIDKVLSGMTPEEFTELFKVMAKYVDKFSPEDLVSYLASDIISQACKDILWKALGNKGVVLPDEAVKFLRGCGVEVRSQQG